MAIKTCIEHVIDELRLDRKVRGQVFVSVQLNEAGSINVYFRNTSIGALHVITYENVESLQRHLES